MSSWSVPPGPSPLARSLLLAGVVTVAFLGALHAPFIGDDRDAILLNEGLHSLAASLSPPRDTSIAGRPVASLSLALNYAIGGLAPRGYHVINLLLHVANTLLVGSLAHRLAGARLPATLAGWSGLLIGLLWGLHPLHTEVVAYVNVRTESLAALAILGVLWLWERAATTGHRGWAWAAVPLSLIGMGCKEHVVLLPLVVLLVDRSVWSGSFRSALDRRGGAVWLALFATAGAGIASIGAAPRSQSVGSHLGVSSWDYLLTQAEVIWHYLRLSFLPFGLQHKYSWAIVSDPTAVTLPFAFLALSVIATVVALWRWPVWGMAGAWFFLWLGPSSSVVPIVTEVAADRRMYLPLLGVIALLALASGPVFRRRPAVVLGLGLVACVGLGARTVDRLHDFRDVISLSESLLAADPDHPGAHQALGPLYYLDGQPDLARDHLLIVLQADPDDIKAHYFLARIDLDQGQPAPAVSHLLAIVDQPGAPADTAALLKQAQAGSP